MVLLYVQTLKLDGKMRELAATLKDEPSMLVFGRGQNYATALETALKVLHKPLTSRSLTTEHLTQLLSA